MKELFERIPDEKKGEEILKSSKETKG